MRTGVARKLDRAEAPEASIPRDRSLDSTLALLRDGYEFISKRCAHHDSDIFETRLMLRKAICIRGEEAARVFYHPNRFTRAGATPPGTLRLLQDKSSVQALDGPAHRHRKQLFMSLMTPESLRQLGDAITAHWYGALGDWERTRRVVLHREVGKVLFAAVSGWAGIPLAERDVKRRTRELTAMIDGAGSFGLRRWWGNRLSAKTERWARGLIERSRARKIEVPRGTALHAIAWHRDLDGLLLDVKTAAIELLNVLRPTVAVDRYITFCALALHDHPEEREKLRDDHHLEMFVQEVRRFYPFFPSVGGRVLDEFEWRGHSFPEGTWVLLDLYGTNHDPRLWDEPDVFRPERFRTWNGSAFKLIPQGGGDPLESHRCAGESITVEVMKRAVRLLTSAMRYEVPRQDLRIDLSRIPALPKSRFVIENVRSTDA